LHQALFAVPRTPDGVAVRLDGAALVHLLEGVARPPRRGRSVAS